MKGDVLSSNGGHCAAVLVYTVKLVKDGSVTYTYQYTDEDIIFEFQVSCMPEGFYFAFLFKDVTAVLLSNSAGDSKAMSAFI